MLLAFVSLLEYRTIGVVHLYGIYGFLISYLCLCFIANGCFCMSDRSIGIATLHELTLPALSLFAGSQRNDYQYPTYVFHGANVTK